MTELKQSQARQRSLLTLWILIAVFALPMVAAWFFYLNPEYLPTARSNRGELVHPARPVGDLVLSTPEGQSVGLETLAGKWTMVTITEGTCATTCRRHLDEFKRIRLALADNRYHTERVLVYAGQGTNADAAAVKSEFPGTRILFAEGESLGELRQRFGTLGDGRFLIDPMGNLMMRYASDAPPEDMLKDLEKLFKASKNWIKGIQYGHR